MHRPKRPQYFLTAALLSIVGAAILWATQPAFAAHNTGSYANLPRWCAPIRTFPLAPAGFAPLHASAAELRTYGFPPQPPDRGPGAAYAIRAWRNALAHERKQTQPHPVCGSLVTRN